MPGAVYCARVPASLEAQAAKNPAKNPVVSVSVWDCHAVPAGALSPVSPGVPVRGWLSRLSLLRRVQRPSARERVPAWALPWALLRVRARHSHPDPDPDPQWLWAPALPPESFCAVDARGR